MNIAICDDNEVVCKSIERVIATLGKSFPEKLNSTVFTSGIALKEHICSGGTFDLIFLDIEMSELNGIEVGKFIREDKFDNLTHIAYISVESSYAMELFENRPFDFLIKPLKHDKIIATIEKSFKIRQNSNEYFEFYRDKIFHRIPFNDIIYFQSNDKKTIIATKSGKFDCYGKLHDIAYPAPKNTFIQIHKSYIVNLTYVSQIQYENILLTNGEVLSISSPHRTAVRKWMMDKRVN